MFVCLLSSYATTQPTTPGGGGGGGLPYETDGDARRLA